MTPRNISDIYEVTATLLHLRIKPDATTQSVNVLPRGTELVAIDPTPEGSWLFVSVVTTGQKGYVHIAHIRKMTAKPSKSSKKEGSHFYDVDKVAFEGLAERRSPANHRVISEKIESKDIISVLSFLDVENASHLRYKPTSKATYCNIYATDFCALLGVYMPRVWWFGSPDSSGKLVTPIYGLNVAEMNANMLTDWLSMHPTAREQWTLHSSPNELRESVNEGGRIGVVSGAISRGIGHISIVVPDHSQNPTLLQSEAGARNRYLGRSEWYKSNRYRKVIFASAKIAL